LSDENGVPRRRPLSRRDREGSSAADPRTPRTGGTVLALWLLPALLFFLPVLILDAPGSKASDLVENMRTSYAEVKDYRADILIRLCMEDGSERVQHLTYTFKKPNRIRVDCRSPHEGVVLIHPGKEGNVVVRPFAWAPFLKLRLPPDASLPWEDTGQRIDQTDLGFLIEGIGRSLTVRSRGAPVIREAGGAVTVRVLAEDLFREDRITRYDFRIDPERWLPVAVEECTPEGELRREVRFRNLRTNLGISDGVFRLEG
jgi:outer membrane lipoprotein-sorting protein